jgi:hypothetical protein
MKVERGLPLAFQSGSPEITRVKSSEYKPFANSKELIATNVIKNILMKAFNSTFDRKK